MNDSLKQDDTAALVHWTYSPDEWHRFVKWKKRTQGLFHYLGHLLFTRKSSKPPDIEVTPSRVSFNARHEHFHNAEYRLQRINIRDAGPLNVVEIAYRRRDQEGGPNAEIKIPVPKGKLMEAIKLQDTLHNSAKWR
jgi:hypothetical protein